MTDSFASAGRNHTETSQYTSHMQYAKYFAAGPMTRHITTEPATTTVTIITMCEHLMQPHVRRKPPELQHLHTSNRWQHLHLTHMQATATTIL
jgi:hypothetical protein